MATVDDHPGALRRVQARRISLDGGPAAVDEPVSVVREAAVTIDIADVGRYTLLCTPQDKRALALGFLLSEGLIDSPADVVGIRKCDDDPNVVRVSLNRSSAAHAVPQRSLLITSSCGACGSEGIDERVHELPQVGRTLQLRAQVLRSVRDTLRREQVLFDVCGGTHAVGLFDATGALITWAEDAGRHNALDKAIGKCLLQNRSPAGHGAALSGRVSLEMVTKCVRAGIEIISAISAPTSLAIEVAERCGVTLCAFVRESRATLFTHPERVIS